MLGNKKIYSVDYRQLSLLIITDFVIVFLTVTDVSLLNYISTVYFHRRNKLTEPGVKTLEYFKELY